MAVFQIVIALLLGGAILAAIARRLSMPGDAAFQQVEQELDIRELDLL